MTNKELKEQYLKEIISTFEKPNSSMYKYYAGIFSNMYTFADGSVYVFEKPKIQTNFCFGYGYNGMSTDEDIARASAEYDLISTDEIHFVDINMEEINSKLVLYQDTDTKLFRKNNHYVNKRLVGIYTSDYLRAYEFDLYMLNEYDDEYTDALAEKGYTVITTKERAEIVKILLEEKEKFLKRLVTYLKKYSLTKIRAWTYLVD